MYAVQYRWFRLYEGVSKSFRNHPKVKEPEMSFLYLIHKTSLKSHFPTFIDCPQTKLVTWVHDTEIHTETSISRN